MAVINPSINFSIGNNGKEYITSFYNYFMENEPQFKSFSTFYKTGLDEDGIYFTRLNNDAKSYNLQYSEDNTRKEILELITNESECQYFIKNSISNSYTDLVNLVNQLGIEISFDIVNVNIILSSFENNVTIVLNELVKHLEDLSNSGAISHINIKVFAVISKSKDLLNSDEQIITFQNIQEIKVIKEKYSSVFQNVVFIDNLNTDTISLEINENSIGFVLNEFITYLMTNHYKMIGNLFGSDYISIGLGTLLFDKFFFNNFFKYKIIKEFIKKEQINDEDNEFETTEYNELRDKVLYPFLRGGANLNNTLIDITKKINVNTKDFTLLEYKFLISNLLGKHNEVVLKKPYPNIEKVSLYDIVFYTLNEYNSAIGEKSINIIEHKRNLDKEIELKKKLAIITQNSKDTPCAKIKKIELQVKELEEKFSKIDDENIEEIKVLENEILELNNDLKQNLTSSNFKDKDEACNNKIIEDLKEEIEKLSEINNEHTQIIEKTIFDFKEKKVKNEIENFIKPKIKNEIIELEKIKDEVKEKRKSFFTRIFKPSLKKRLVNTSKEISDKTSQINNIDDSFDTANTKSLQLFEYIDKLEKFYSLLSNSINTILKNKDNYKERFENTELLDYLFVKNIVDKEILREYYNSNNKRLQSHLSDVLQKLVEISNDNNVDKKEQAFNEFLSNKLLEITSSIIDFNIVKYLNGDYDNLNLLKQEPLDEIIDDLLKISKPFFNADNSFNTNNSHCLMLHNSESSSCVNTLHNLLKNNFTATIPQKIDTENNNKFSIVKIDIIEDFKHIVKYSQSEIVYKKSNVDTIIIR